MRKMEMTKSNYAKKFASFVYRKPAFLKATRVPDSNGHMGCKIFVHFENITFKTMEKYIEEFHNRLECKRFYIKMEHIQDDVVTLTSSWKNTTIDLKKR